MINQFTIQRLRDRCVMMLCLGVFVSLTDSQRQTNQTRLGRSEEAAASSAAAEALISH